MDADLNDALAALVTRLQDEINKEFAERYSNLTPPTVEVDPSGRKFIRIVKQGSQRMVWGFVATCDGKTKSMGEWKRGDIFRAATYKAPAKHARGNVFDPNWWDNCTIYAPKYLK